jgi:alanine dehydrogenase
MVEAMKSGAVIVDVAIDQGGCVETSRPTTHQHPTFVVNEVIHYCVPNMPGAVARTSTFALTNMTLPYALTLANEGFIGAIAKDSSLQKGVNLYKGTVTHPNVAHSLGYAYSPLKQLLSA